MMNTANYIDTDLTTFGPDLFLRYFIVFNSIRNIHGKRKCSIIDVGGRSGLLGNFILQNHLPYHLTVVDLREDDLNNPTVCDNYIQGDIFAFPVMSYDFVVSIDTLEHVANKNEFLIKLLRLKGIIIISAPFQSPDVVYAEKQVNHFFKSFARIDHPWLSEHLEYKLPKIKDLQKQAKILNLEYQIINSNSINSWIQFMCINFLPAFFSLPKQFTDELNSFYNHNYAKLGDQTEPSYRKIIVLSKLKLKRLQNESQPIDPKLVYSFQTKMATTYTSVIKGLVESLSVYQKEYSDPINSLFIARKETIQWQNHAHNLELVIENITSARFYKVWQLIKKIQNHSNLLLNIWHLGYKEMLVRTMDKARYIFSNNSALKNINLEYSAYFNNSKPTKAQLAEQNDSSHKFNYRPIISVIVPIYNPDIELLRACVDSVLNQSYDNWQLCLADDASSNKAVKEILEEYIKMDARISVIFRKHNGNISEASNSACSIAKGKYVGFLDQDDELSSDALFEVAKKINNAKGNVDLIYSDEDKIESNGRHVEPYFKPDWSPDLLLSLNYLTHFTVIKRSLLDRMGGFNKNFDGSQDYELFLRVTEVTNKILHIPKVLYSWRKTPNSTAQRYAAKPYANRTSISALETTLRRRKISGIVEKGLVEGTFRVRYSITDEPLISIIVATKNQADLLKTCIKSIENKTTYKNYELIVVDTGSTEKDATELLECLNRNNPKIAVLFWNKTFNYSAVNNFAVNHAKGDYLIFLNNDTEIITPEWIESLLEHAQRKLVGAVGAKLLYPDGTIQHAGVVLGIRGGSIKRGIAGHLFKREVDKPMGYAMGNSKDEIRNCSAVTAACLMIKKQKFLAVGGFDEKLVIAFNDVDLNLKLLNCGLYNVYTPYAKLFHHESVSVGNPQNGKRDLKQFQFEIDLMINRWDKILENDPFYNSNLSLQNEKIEIKT